MNRGGGRVGLAVAVKVVLLYISTHWKEVSMHAGKGEESYCAYCGGAKGCRVADKLQGRLAPGATAAGLWRSSLQESTTWRFHATVTDTLASASNRMVATTLDSVKAVPYHLPLHRTTACCMPAGWDRPPARLRYPCPPALFSTPHAPVTLPDPSVIRPHAQCGALPPTHLRCTTGGQPCATGLRGCLGRSPHGHSI